MRIGFITPGYPRNKNDYSGIFIQYLAKQISKNNTVDIFVPADIEDTVEDNQNPNLSIKRIRYAPSFLQFLFYRPSGGFPQLIRSKKPILLLLPFALFFISWGIFFRSRKCDIIHCHWIPTLIFAILPKLIYRKKIFITIRGSDLKIAEKSSLFKTIFSFLMIFSDKVIAVGDSVKEKAEFIFYHHKNKIVTIPNGITFKERGEINKKSTNLNILFVGNLVKEKGILELKESVEKLLSSGYPIRLTLIGDKNTVLKEEINNWAKRHPKNIKITGMLDHPQVLAHMAKADLFVLPSYSEGRSNVLLEAMGSEIAVVASDLPEIKEIINEGNIKNKENGILVPSANGPALHKAMEMLINNPKRRRTIAKNGKQTIINLNVNWQHSAERHLASYQSILNK